nr:EOG090X0AVR [Ceriodaphnia reticulata]
MDQRLANKLFEEGAVLLIHDLPVGTELGIDLNSWKTGEKFKGVKMIPPGIHFVYYSSVSKEGSVAPRTGFFHNFRKKDVVIRRWEPEIEDMVDLSTEQERECIKANLKNLDQNLGPYPFETWKKWLSLSSKLTTDVVRRIEPHSKKVTSVAELIVNEAIQPDESQSKERQVKRVNIESQLLPSMHVKPDTELNFTNIPPSSYPEGSSASEITKFSIDTSYMLKQMLSSMEEPLYILAELQMAFLCFLIGQVYSAFEHWKNLVRIICFADDMVLQNPSLFMEFIGDFYFQMQEVPTDMFVDIVSSENFLIQTLRVLFGNVLENEEVDNQLKRRTSHLKLFVTQRFQWDFDVEPDDEAPVVVGGDDN